MSDDTNQEQSEPKRTNLPQNIPIRLIGYDILRQAGLNQSESGQVLGIKRTRATQIEQMLNKYGLRGDISKLKLASNVVKNILKGKPREEDQSFVKEIDGEKTIIPFSSKVYPSHNVQLQAAAMVYDRVEPLRTEARLDVYAHMDTSEVDQRIGALLAALPREMLPVGETVDAEAQSGVDL
jgi:hypothetical protein